MIAFVLLAAAATGGAAADRRVPFWGDEVPRAIAAEVDGVAVLETVRALGRFHRVLARRPWPSIVPGLATTAFRFAAPTYVARSTSTTTTISRRSWGRTGRPPLSQLEAAATSSPTSA